MYVIARMPDPFVAEESEALKTWINHQQNRGKCRDKGWDLNVLRAMKAY